MLRPILLVVAFAVISIALVFAYPDRLINPGPLMDGHRGLKNSCLSCHKPFGGASLQCISCHRQSDIGVRTVAGQVLPNRSGKTLFHRGFAANSCVGCHTDHKGNKPKLAIRSFMHDSLPASLKNNCNACHSEQRPKDNLHRQVGQGCASCHDTAKWTNAAFDHTRLSAVQQCISCHKRDKPGDSLHRQTGDNCTSCHDTVKWKNVFFDHNQLSAQAGQCIACHRKDVPGDALHRQSGESCATCHDTRKWKNAVVDHSKLSVAGKQCISCHTKDVPADALHRQSKANCSECHKTDRWKPATFDHDRYFRLDGDHRASCVTCHPNPKNYKAYTCYNCHEHSPSRIEREHRKEGIGNYDNCIRCHRDARGEHEGGERWKGREHGEGWGSRKGRDDDD